MNDDQRGLIAAAKQAHQCAGEDEWTELTTLLDRMCSIPDGFVPCQFAGDWECWSDGNLNRSLEAKVRGASHVGITVEQTDGGELVDWSIEVHHPGSEPTQFEPSAAVAIARDLLLAVEHAKSLGYTK